MRNVATAKPNKDSKLKKNIIKEFGIDNYEYCRSVVLMENELFEEINLGTRMLIDKQGNKLLVDYEPGLVIIDEWVYARKDGKLYCFSFDDDGEVVKKHIKLRGNVRFNERTVLLLSKRKENKIVAVYHHGLKPIIRDNKGITVVEEDNKLKFISNSGIHAYLLIH